VLGTCVKPWIRLANKPTHNSITTRTHLSPYIETPLDPSWFWKKVMFAVCDKEPPKIVDSYVEISGEPGAGYSISIEKIKKFSIS